jgi:hypothetical protein
VWSIINFRGTGWPQIVRSTLKQDKYEEILEGRLLSKLSEWFGDGEDPIFMHEGTSSGSVSKVLTEIGLRISDLPGNLPDTNPVKNVWKIFKRKSLK